MGPVSIEPSEVLATLWSKLGGAAPTLDEGKVAVLWEIRLPRVAAGVLIGTLLALCGTLLQGLFRNPLADPGLLGVSSGAAFAAALFLVFGSGPTGLPVAAFAGALAATFLVRKLGGDRVDPGTLLLAGIAVNAFAGAGTGLLSFLANDAQLRSLTFWSLGSLGGSSWTTVGLLCVPVVVLCLWSKRIATQVDALLLGEREAAHLGVDVKRLQRELVLASALGVSATVAAAGMIGFVGLVVPNLLRLILGPSHGRLLVASGLTGGIVLVGGDLVARTSVAPTELPIGVVTSLIGAPFFAWLLIRRRRGITT